MSAPPALSKAADAHTRDKLAWLLIVARTPDLPAAAHRLAALIALHYLSRARGMAWPSISTLCVDLEATKATVLRAVAALEGAGLLTVQRSRGRGHANEYRLTTPPEKGIADDTFSGDGKGIADATFSTGKGIVSALEKVSPTIPQPFEEPSEGARARSRATAAPQPFEGEKNDRHKDEPGQVRALRRAPLPDPEAGLQVLDDEDLHPDAALEPYPLDPARGCPATLADLDRRDRLEWGPADPDADDPVADCARALAGLGLADPGALARDLAAGFVATPTDPAAATRAAEAVALAMVRAGRDGAGRTWATIRRATFCLALGTTDRPTSADAAIEALHDAVVAAAATAKAARRATAATLEARHG